MNTEFQKLRMKQALRVSPAALAIAALILVAPTFAQTKTRGPEPSDSIVGNYLAARHASTDRDAAAAAIYYRDALKIDPKNTDLLDSAFVTSLIGGDVAEAVRLGERILKRDKTNQFARLVVGVHALKQKKYTLARQNLNQSVSGPITDLVAALLSGWSMAGAGNAAGAIATIDKLEGPDWYPLFKNLHTGLIADLAGRNKDAGTRYENAYKLDKSTFHIIDAYGRWLTRHGSMDAARAVYEDYAKNAADNPMVDNALLQIAAGRKLPPLVTTPQEGAAEVLYGIGAAFGRRGGEDRALVYLQLALYLDPGHAPALLALADFYETIKRPQLALSVYERVPATSLLKRNAQIQLATGLDSVERTDEGLKILRDLIAANPNDIGAVLALGNIERTRKKFSECAETYSKALDLTKDRQKPNWVLYYFRGICRERSNQWPLAEADLKKALELQPDEAHVLNYLGYSWIDKGINLEQAMQMIRRAVEQRPDDGYIVDSLGWAYYRIGDYEQAQKSLERAIELKPEDPTINDHLGDIYWRVDRKLEAKFQWSHARDLNPDPVDLPKIEAKIRDGLPPDQPSAAAADKDKKDGKGG